jgi:hypothetical protein
MVTEAWKESWFGYVLIVATFCVFLWFSWHLPPAGYAVTTMAVVAGVMALRPEMGGREKWFWFAMLLAFMGVEVRAINRDRGDQNHR